MVRISEEIELRRIVESFLRHASFRFNGDRFYSDSANLRSRPRTGLVGEVGSQLTEPAQVQRHADWGEVATFDDDSVFFGPDRQQFRFAHLVVPAFELIHRKRYPPICQRQAQHDRHLAVGGNFAPRRGRRGEQRAVSGVDFDAHAERPPIFSLEPAAGSLTFF